MASHSTVGSPVTPALANHPNDTALHLLCLAAEGNRQHRPLLPSHSHPIPQLAHSQHHPQPHYPFYVSPPPPSHYHQSPHYLYHPLHYTPQPHPIMHHPIPYQQHQHEQQQQHQHQQHQQPHHHLPYSPLLHTQPSPVLPVPVPVTHPPTHSLSPIQSHPVHKVKGPWRPEEDNILTELVSKLGPRRWTVIASHIPGRTGKQARERWLNQLSPHLAKRPWTPEEDTIVMDAHARLGNRWSEIAKLLNGRTDNATKNRFNTTIRRQISELSTHAREELAAGVNNKVDAVATSAVTSASKSITPPTSPNTSDAEPDLKVGVKRNREATSRIVLEPMAQRPKTVTASS